MPITIVLLATTLVVIVALLTAAGAATLARLEGATCPAAIRQAAIAFAAVIALAAAVVTVFI